MGGFIWPEVLNFVRDQAADIIVLQEVYAGITQVWTKIPVAAALWSCFPRVRFRFLPWLGISGQWKGSWTMAIRYWAAGQFSEKQRLFDMPYAVVDHDNTTDFLVGQRVPAGSNWSTRQREKLQVVNIHGPVWMNGAELTPRRQQMIKTLDSFLLHHCRQLLLEIAMPQWIILVGSYCSNLTTLCLDRHSRPLLIWGERNCRVMPLQQLMFSWLLQILQLSQLSVLTLMFLTTYQW